MTKTLTAALLGAASLVVLSLPVNAASSTTVTDTPRVASESMQLAQAQRPYDPSAGSVGFKKGTETAQRRDDPSAGSVGFKKAKKAKKAKKKAKK